MTSSEIAPADAEKAIRALERRFGRSTMPYRITAGRGSTPTNIYFEVEDVETGSCLGVAIRGDRLRVVSAFDGAA